MVCVTNCLIGCVLLTSMLSCMLTSQTSDVFKNFKSDPRYTAILEHVPVEQGRLYAEDILQYDIDDELISSFKDNDLIGGSNTFNYGGSLGIISPSTLRYIQNALDISKWFFKNKVNVEHKDISFDINEVTDDIIINTSCEHMWHMRDIKMNGVCAFQSNNFKQDNAHVNCVGSLEEFTYQTGLTKLFFKGVKPFHHINDGSERYMLIGEQ